MSGFVIDGAFTECPVGATLAETLIANDNLINWFQADPSHVTLNGPKIVTFVDRKGTGQTFTQSTNTKRPSLALGTAGDYASALFDKAASQQCALTGDAPDFNAAFSFVGTFKAAAAYAEARYMLGADSGNGFFVGQTGADEIIFKFGTGATVQIDLDAGQEESWNYYIATFDGTDKIRLSINGGAASVFVGLTPPTVTGAIALGSKATAGTGFFDGYMTDFMHIDVDLFEAANAELLALVQDLIETSCPIGT